MTHSVLMLLSVHPRSLLHLCSCPLHMSRGAADRPLDRELGQQGPPLVPLELRVQGALYSRCSPDSERPSDQMGCTEEAQTGVLCLWLTDGNVPGSHHRSQLGHSQVGLACGTMTDLQRTSHRTPAKRGND